MTRKTQKVCDVDFITQIIYKKFPVWIIFSFKKMTYNNKNQTFCKLAILELMKRSSADRQNEKYITIEFVFYVEEINSLI